MSSSSSVELSRLRDIGWNEWDPIGLLGQGESWDGKPFADEYDDYLLYLAASLRRAEPLGDAVAYLVSIEREHIGLGRRDGQEIRARATALAVRDYLAELDDRSPPAARG